MTTQPIIKCPRGFAYGYVPIDATREIADLDEDGRFAASSNAVWARKNPPVTAG